MKNIFAKLFLLITFVGLMYFNTMNATAAEVTGSGTCGDNLTWVAYSDGSLIISGEGEMNNYSYKDMNFAEWFIPAVTVTNVTIEEGVTSIGDYAFYNCNLMTSITIPESVNEIGSYAFNLCEGLESIELPSNIVTISEGTFSQCKNLKDINIPNGVTAIGARAFSNCKSLESITIPDNVSSIGEYAFGNCDMLTELTIPCNVSEIRGGAFSGCNSLNKILVDNENTNFCTDGDKALFNKEKTELIVVLPTITGEYVIPEGVNKICDGAFYDCSELTGVVIQEGVESIGNSSFIYCSGITNLEFPSSLKTIGTSAFYKCIGLTEIVIPENVTSFEDSFSYCHNLKSVEISEGVTEVSSWAFHMCDSLENVSLPSTITTIDTYAFMDCEKLQSITLPDNLITIDWYAFANSGLTEITIPEKTKYIRDGAFRETSLTEIIIPDSVEIVDGAFWGCSSLENVVIGKGITEITNHTFSYCTKLKGIEIPDNVTAIYPSSFRSCGLTSITIPESITSIGTYAFAECNDMKEIYFEGDAPTFGMYTFDGISTVAYYPENNETWTEDVMQNYGGTVTWESYRKEIASGTCGTDLTWILYEDGCLQINGTGTMTSYSNSSKAPWYSYRSSITSVEVADGVTQINSYAFYQCSALESVEIPDSVQFVGQFAFYQCAKINDVVIPEGVASIRQYTFYGCKALRNLTLPSTIEYIDQYAFGECVFADFVIPEGVTRIFAWAFYMANWDSLVLPDSLTLMGEYIFSNAAGNKGIITTPANVKSIPSGAYAMCGNMTGIKFADGVTSIGNNALRYCGNLTEVWIPDSVTSISSGAFYGCTPEEITIYGSEGSYAETYATTYGFNFVVEDNFEIVTQPTDQSVEIGENAIFTVEATGNDLTYQWQYSTTGNSWYDSGMTGYDTNQLTVPALMKRDGQMYKCIITDSEGNQLITNEVILTVEEPIKLEIISQPVNQSTSAGGMVVFTVEATGEELAYQWQYSTSAGKYWFDSGMTGSTTSELTVEALKKRDGQMYRCVVTDANNNKVTSDAATLTILANELSILTQPESQKVSVGETVKFVVEAEGTDLTYQWQYSNSSGKYWYNSGMTGSTTNELTVEALAKRDGQMYRCVVTDASGNEIMSETATLTIASAAIVVTLQPTDVTTASGEIVKFVVEAEGTGLTYQWQYSNNGGKYWYDSGMTGNKTNELTVEALAKRDGQMYQCVITDADGNTIISDAGTLTISE